MTDRNFIACLEEDFRVGKVIEWSISTTENATNVQYKAINTIYEFVKASYSFTSSFNVLGSIDVG